MALSFSAKPADMALQDVAAADAGSRSELGDEEQRSLTAEPRPQLTAAADDLDATFDVHEHATRNATVAARPGSTTVSSSPSRGRSERRRTGTPTSARCTATRAFPEAAAEQLACACGAGAPARYRRARYRHNYTAASGSVEHRQLIHRARYHGGCRSDVCDSICAVAHHQRRWRAQAAL